MATANTNSSDTRQQQDTKHTSPERVQRYNIDRIDLTSSPIHTHPRHFQPGTLLDAQTFERIRSNVYNPPKKCKEEEKGDDDNNQQDLHDILDQARATEMEHLSQLIHRDRPTDANQIADILLELIRSIPETTVAAASTILDMRNTDELAEATKGANYIEYGTYQSISTRGKKQWPAASSDHGHQSTKAITTATGMATRAQPEERRHIARQALDLAETNVHDAMDFIRHSMPDKFLAQSTWYLRAFKYIHLRAQQEADRRGDVAKEYVWPLSFPDCTPQLREAIDRWIRHHFSRPKHAKCLILIGPTDTGKTSFALSLPGHVNYFQGQWNLDGWNDYARYSVYDGVPWDQFKKLNYPDKERLLTQNGKMNATDKYRGRQEINVQQPAIVLLNPEDAGSLTAEPTTAAQQQYATFWKKRAFIYTMGPDEYFYRRTRLTTNAGGDVTPVSSNSSTPTNEARIGELDEFEKMIQRYQQKHSK